VTPLAAVVLAHTDPEHLRRLVGALEDVPIFLHVDARTKPDMAHHMVYRLPRRVVLCDRLPTSRASWSLVEAEIRALRRALDHTRAQHIAVLSGTDYPLLSMPDLVRHLADWEGESFFRNVPLPFPQWDTPTHRDGGRWRVEHRFLRYRGQIIFVRDVPLRWPIRRRVPAELELRASSQWKIYARRHAELLVRFADTRPDLLRFWRSTLVPDESFAASMLGSRAIAGADAMPPCPAQPWYVTWPGTGSHPRWLGSEDFDGLAAARWAPPISAAAAVGRPGTQIETHRKLFARKFSASRDRDVLDRIDAELRR
jgi:core-2/I-Branching enzyme